jgi:hypothetical protein
MCRNIMRRAIHCLCLISNKYLSGGLQDMGEEYTEAELGLTSCYLDSDNLGTVDFADFVRWWCE